MAADCAKLDAPNTTDYNVLELWIVQNFLPAYADCASRHHQTVKAWPQ